MASLSPRQALWRLHRTVSMVFREDRYAIVEARKKIREEFEKNRNVEDAEKIRELVKMAQDADATLRTVVQLKLDPERDVYRVRTHAGLQYTDNIPYEPLPPDFKPERQRRRKREEEKTTE